jgi:hypothetical protein
MFYFTKEKNNYYIWSDNIKWKFWPFKGIISKNKYLWDTWKIKKTNLWKEQNFLEKKYSFFKYNFGFSEDKIFVINKNWIEKIINK